MRRVMNSGRIGAEQSGSSENTNASSAAAIPSVAAGSSIATRWRASIVVVAGSMLSQRAWWVFVVLITTVPPASLTAVSTRKRCQSKSTRSRRKAAQFAASKARRRGEREHWGKLGVELVRFVQQRDQLVDLGRDHLPLHMFRSRKFELAHRVPSDDAATAGPPQRTVEQRFCTGSCDCGSCQSCESPRTDDRCRLR